MASCELSKLLSEEEERINYVHYIQQTQAQQQYYPAEIEYTLFVYTSSAPWKGRKPLASSKDVVAILKLKDEYEKGIQKLCLDTYSGDYGLLFTVEVGYAYASCKIVYVKSHLPR